MNTSSPENEVIQSKTVSKPVAQAFADAHRALVKVGEVGESDTLSNTLIGAVQVLDNMIDFQVAVEARDGGSAITARAPKAPFPDLSGQAAVKNFFDALERPDMPVRRAGKAVGTVSAHIPANRKAGGSSLPYILGGLALVIVIGIFGFGWIGGKPPRSAIEEAIKQGNGFRDAVLGGPDSTQFDYQHGETLVSEGGYGPVGTRVYTVRVTFTIVSLNWQNRKMTRDIYFWKDPFGNWVSRFVY